MASYVQLHTLTEDLTLGPPSHQIRRVMDTKDYWTASSGREFVICSLPTSPAAAAVRVAAPDGPHPLCQLQGSPPDSTSPRGPRQQQGRGSTIGREAIGQSIILDPAFKEHFRALNMTPRYRRVKGGRPNVLYPTD